MHVYGVNRVILHSVKAGCPIRGNKYLCTLVSLNLGWPWITKPALGGAQHSTEVTFALLTQQPRVRFLEFPKLLEIKSTALRVWRSLNKSMEPSSTSPELVLQKTCVDQPIGHDWGSTLGTLTSDWRQMGAKLRFKVRSKLLLLGIPNISLAKKEIWKGRNGLVTQLWCPGTPGLGFKCLIHLYDYVAMCATLLPSFDPVSQGTTPAVILLVRTSRPRGPFFNPYTPPPLGWVTWPKHLLKPLPGGPPSLCQISAR